MKTNFALGVYAVAIVILLLFAFVIVGKLIVFPPCTQTGNTCVVEPWSVAGLAGTVLAVAAMLLAILGAVAVAAWWTSLNNIVTERVQKLNRRQQKEVNAQVDLLLKEQQTKVDAQLEGFQTAFRSVEGRINNATVEINELEKLTHDFFDVAVDGIMLLEASSLEEWAQKVTSLHKFPRVPLKMAERYLDVVEHGLPQAEQLLMRDKDFLSEEFKQFQERAASSDTDPRLQLGNAVYIQDMNRNHLSWLKGTANNSYPPAYTLMNWEGLLRWKKVAEDEKADSEALQRLEGKIGAYQFKLDQLKQGHSQLKEQAQLLFELTERYLKEKGALLDEHHLRYYIE